MKLEKELADVKRKWFHRKEQKELEGKIETKKVQLEKTKATLDLLPAQHGYKNALEVTKAMKTAKAELQEVRKKQKVWNQEEAEFAERLYLTIPANVQRVERQEEIKSSRQKQN